MGYRNGHPSSWSRVKTKKDLKQAVAELNADKSAQDIDVELTDLGASGRINLRDFFKEFPNDTLMITNHPKRSWYANVVLGHDGRIIVS